MEQNENGPQIFVFDIWLLNFCIICYVFAPKHEKSKIQNCIGGKFQRQLFKWPPKTNGKTKRHNFCFQMTVTDDQELSESFGESTLPWAG